jgi:hypothetical protein
MHYREQAIEQCLRRIDLPETSSESDGLPASKSPAMLGACERFRRSGMKSNQDWPLMDSISPRLALKASRKCAGIFLPVSKRCSMARKPAHVCVERSRRCTIGEVVSAKSMRKLPFLGNGPKFKTRFLVHPGLQN